jgi:3-phenylpropionate/trans-cinnamate dioxygenase ferredoxin reductase subunit
LYLKSAEGYARHQIDCRYGIGVESIDRDARSVRLFDSTTVPYGHLVLATGGRARRLSLPGANHPNVHYVRTIDDILKLKEQFLPGTRLLIIGGGYIGLEAASVGIKKGLKVTLVEALPRLLARVTVPELSAFYERAHRARGVQIFTGVGVHSLEGDPLVTEVELSDSRRLAVDLLIVGIGMIPNTELAEACGLEVHNGIVVDPFNRTSDPRVFAIGDCSNQENTFLERRVRLESVPNAAEQIRVCAASICGKPVPNNAVPWFWSDQYDLKLQMVGLSQDSDQLAIRGNPDKESFCAFHLRAGVVIAADAVNRAPDFMVAKKLVAERVRATVEQLADETFPLKSLLPVKGA